MTYTLKGIAETLPGARWPMIRKDLERLGYLSNPSGSKQWLITTQGGGLFEYHSDPKWGCYPVATDAGYQRIITHYANDELSMYPLYYYSCGDRIYHPGRVVKLALENEDKLDDMELQLVTEVLNGRDQRDAYRITTWSEQPVSVHDRLNLLGHKLDGYTPRERQQKWLSGWRPALGGSSFGRLYPPL